MGLTISDWLLNELLESPIVMVVHRYRQPLLMTVCIAVILIVYYYRLDWRLIDNRRIDDKMDDDDQRRRMCDYYFLNRSIYDAQQSLRSVSVNVSVYSEVYFLSPH